MNQEQKKDDLLAAFENPDTDPTPDIAPVMPESVSNPMPINNIVAPEFQTVTNESVVPTMPEAVPNYMPVNDMVAPEFQTAINETAIPVAPVEATPEIPVVQQPVAESVAGVKETPVIENVVEPSIDLAQQQKKNEVDAIQDDPKFLKKNFKFILILCGVILAFILLLPKIMGILGTKF